MYYSPMKQRKKSPAQTLVLGFAFIILIGSILLVLPTSTVKPISYIDALFTSVSSVCVTGLVTIDIGNTFTIFGKVIIAILIQVGGLSFASLAIFLLVLFGKTPSLSGTRLLKQALNLKSSKNLGSLVKTVAVATIIIETIGFGLTFEAIKDYYPTKTALGISAFHAISAFNNAGIDIIGNFESLTGFRTNTLLNLTTCLLIITGGLGFYSLRDIVVHKKWRKFSNHTKIVLSATGFLIISGTLLILLTNIGSGISFMDAFFQSVTARTAGFNTIDLNAISHAGLFIIMSLMFIGASPGSTGGGVKTTTAFAAVISISGFIRNREPSEFKRRISKGSTLKAFSIILLAIMAILISCLLVLTIEGSRFTFLEVFFESISAFGTVGLSLGITTSLCDASKLVIMLLMFVGRLGPLTLVSSRKMKHIDIKYIEEDILIG